MYLRLIRKPPFSQPLSASYLTCGQTGLSGSLSPRFRCGKLGAIDVHQPRAALFGLIAQCRLCISQKSNFRARSPKCDGQSANLMDWILRSSEQSLRWEWARHDMAQELWQLWTARLWRIGKFQEQMCIMQKQPFQRRMLVGSPTVGLTWWTPGKNNFRQFRMFGRFWQSPTVPFGAWVRVGLMVLEAQQTLSFN